MKGSTLFLLGIGAYFVYQYMHHPPSPPMQPPPGSGIGTGGASNQMWTGIQWINCSSPGADPTMCAQLQQSTILY